jgi:Putative prokaryotic signal transducing protein
MANDTAMTPVFSSSNHDAEMEAMAIKGLLDSNDIPAVVVGPQILPNLEFQVQVPEDLLDRARQTIRDARQGGRKAADEAEAASEK